MEFKMKVSLVLAVAALGAFAASEAKQMHYIHWNKANPMFRLDNTDHIVEVNNGNLPWEYDQVNIICPVSKPGTPYPESHVIYSVSREEFDSCRITNPKPKIVAICNQPHRLMYFTITFRSFTPTPGGLEFRPGQDYYFISTSSREDLHRRVGGGCSTHNMKMIFKVADNRAPEEHTSLNEPRLSDSLDRTENEIDNALNNDKIFEAPSTEQPATTTQRSVFRYNTKVPRMKGGEYIYYYHPRDLIELENNSLYGKNRRQQTYDNEIWRNKALRYTSGAVSISSGLVTAVTAVVICFMAL